MLGSGKEPDPLVIQKRLSMEIGSFIIKGAVEISRNCLNLSEGFCEYGAFYARSSRRFAPAGKRSGRISRPAGCTGGSR